MTGAGGGSTWRWLLVAAAAALAFATATCGVDFVPDRFCYSCADDPDCGDAHWCYQPTGPGKDGYCLPEDEAKREGHACNPPADVGR